MIEKGALQPDFQSDDYRANRDRALEWVRTDIADRFED